MYIKHNLQINFAQNILYIYIAAIQQFYVKLKFKY